MVARRLRLAFLNVQAAQEALPMIIEIMAEELKWSKEEQEVRHPILTFHVRIKEL
jgi:hypothetical protein